MNRNPPKTLYNTSKVTTERVDSDQASDSCAEHAPFVSESRLASWCTPTHSSLHPHRPPHWLMTLNALPNKAIGKILRFHWTKLISKNEFTNLAPFVTSYGNESTEKMPNVLIVPVRDLNYSKIRRKDQMF